jgi:hypothetical protein
MRPHLNYEALLGQLAGSPGAPMPGPDPRPPYDADSFRTNLEQAQPFAPELKGGVMETYARYFPHPLATELLQRR